MHDSFSRILVALSLVLLAVAASGCTDDAAGGQCANDNDCPSATTCVSGVCVMAVSDMDASVDAPSDADGTIDARPDQDLSDGSPDQGGDGPTDAGDTVTVCDCGPGEICCEDTCVDPQTSPLHCGQCALSCLEAPQVAAGTCEQGGCIIDACLPGFEDCDNEPVNGCETALNQPGSCGACGVVCGMGEVCNDGQCACGGNTMTGDAVCTGGDICCNGTCGPAGAPACTCANCMPNENCCGGACIDVSADVTNCGACGNACNPGEVCTNNTCACPSGQLGDDNNCGACGNACGSGSSCVAGSCQCPGGGQVGDDNNCGACGTTCSNGETCQGGSCACAMGTLNDTQNCGACGTACPQGGTCDLVAGSYTCSCPATGATCMGMCVDTDSDVNNCGGCGTTCGSGSTTNPLCLGGTCYQTCRNNRGNCDNLDFNGCEVNLAGNNSCGPNCATRVGCGWNDSCSTSGGTPHCECDNGVVCNPGEACQGRDDRCSCGGGSACGADQFCCRTSAFSRGCFSVLTDRNNCGACGVQCGNGEMCVAGVCQ